MDMIENKTACTGLRPNLIEKFTFTDITMDLEIIREQPLLCVKPKIHVESNVNVVHENRSLINDIQKLIKLYRKRMGDSKISVMSGGLQQFLNKQNVENEKSMSVQHVKGFNKLPVNVKLQIFSYLSPRELCQSCRVCQEWFVLTQDDVLWKQKLQKDKMIWNIISHCTNPDIYQETQSDLSSKEIYLRCSPEVNNSIHKQYNMVTNLTNLLRYFIPKKTPKIAMFGPGLESHKTSKIARILLNLEVFQIVGYVPGQFGGVGSGATIKRKDTGTIFTLSLLYSASKQEREQPGRDRTRGNHLVEHVQDEEGEITTVLKPAVRSFCQTVDAFVFVIDGSESADAVMKGKAELQAMVNERWSASNVPVLVLSCVETGGAKGMSSYDVCQKLDMITLNRPWQVRQCDPECKTGVCDGLQWLVDQSHRQYS